MAAPSFGSFPVLERREEASSSREATPAWKDEQLNRARKRKRKQDKQKDNNKTEEEGFAPALVEFDFSEETAFPRRAKATDSNPIVVHLLPDSDNLRYGSLHSRTIPKFRRIIQGRVIGLHPSLRIVKSQQASRRDLTVLPRTQHRLDRYTDKSQAWRLFRADVKLQSVLPENVGKRATSQPESAFIGLLDEDVSASEGEKEPGIDPDYRNLGEAPRRPPSDSESNDSGSEEDRLVISRGTSTVDRIALRNTELSTQCQIEPGNINNWLAFVKYQNEFLASSRSAFLSGRTKSEKEENRAIADGKLAILDKAIDLNRRNPDLKILVKERLSVGEVVWAPEEINKEWKRALKRYAGPEAADRSLLIDWLLWKRCNGQQFKMRSGYLSDAAQVLSSSGIWTSQKLDIFATVADDFKQAGYPERGTALVQAMIELNFCTPTPLQNSSLDEQLDDLETFWDSEAPRFGEFGAKGWKLTETDADPPSALKTPDFATFAKENEPNDGYAKWAKAETLLASQKSYPARLVDSTDDDDVYRVVLFADIKPFLFFIAGDDQYNRQLLMYYYLASIGLPLLPPGVDTNAISGSQFLMEAFAKSTNPAKAAQKESPEQSFVVIAGEAMERARKATVQSPAAATINHCYPLSWDMLLLSEETGWPTVSFDEAIEQNGKERLQESLEQIAKVWPDLRARLLLLLFISRQSLTIGAKLAKQMLTAEPENLILWTAYAAIETARGKHEEALRVFEQTRLQLPRLSTMFRLDAPFFWTAFVNFQMDHGSDGVPLSTAVKAIYNLCTSQNAAEEDQLSRPTIARAKMMLTEHLRMLHSTGTKHYESWINLALIVEYLDSGITAAIAFAATYIQQSTAEVEERIRMMLCRLCYRHSRLQRSFRPADLSDVAQQSMERFPNNSIFFATFFFSELRTKIQDRVRNTLDRLCKDSPTSLTWMYRIFTEFQFDVNASNQARIRYVFDQAASSLRQRPSLAIWSYYLNWLASDSRNATPAQLRSAHVQALQECPYGKSIFLQACLIPNTATWLRGDLAAIVQNLSERELRNLVDPAPYVAIEELNFGDEFGDDGDFIDPALRDLAERKRLMPYG